MTSPRASSGFIGNGWRNVHISFSLFSSILYAALLIPVSMCIYPIMPPCLSLSRCAYTPSCRLAYPCLDVHIPTPSIHPSARTSSRARTGEPPCSCLHGATRPRSARKLLSRGAWPGIPASASWHWPTPPRCETLYVQPALLGTCTGVPAYRHTGVPIEIAKPRLSCWSSTLQLFYISRLILSCILLTLGRFLLLTLPPPHTRQVLLCEVGPSFRAVASIPLEGAYGLEWASRQLYVLTPTQVGGLYSVIRSTVRCEQCEHVYSAIH